MTAIYPSICESTPRSSEDTLKLVVLGMDFTEWKGKALSADGNKKK